MSALDRELMIGVMASLAAAISLLERSPKTAAPSDKMFDQMLADYRKSLDAARASLAPPKGQAEAVAAMLDAETWLEALVRDAAPGSEDSAHEVIKTITRLKAARSALASPAPAGRAVEGWQTVESAPKNSLVLGYFGTDLPDNAPFIGPEIWSVWQDEFGVWYGDHHSSFTATEKYEPPTHWMPLPAAPIPEGENRDG